MLEALFHNTVSALCYEIAGNQGQPRAAGSDSECPLGPARAGESPAPPTRDQLLAGAGGAGIQPAETFFSNPLGPPYNDVTRFVIEQHGGMPHVLGAAVRLATLLFALSALGRDGTLFHRLEPPRRRLQVAAWTASRLGPCRDLMRLYSSLVILALYSRPGLEQGLGRCG